MRALVALLCTALLLAGCSEPAKKKGGDGPEADGSDLLDPSGSLDDPSASQDPSDGVDPGTVEPEIGASVPTSSSASSTGSGSTQTTSSSASATGSSSSSGSGGSSTSSSSSSSTSPPLGPPAPVTASCLTPSGYTGATPQVCSTANMVSSTGASFTKANVSVAYSGVGVPGVTITLKDGAGNVLGNGTGASPIKIEVAAAKVPQGAIIQMQISANATTFINFQANATFMAS